MDYSDIEKFYYADINNDISLNKDYFSKGVIYDIPTEIFIDKKYVPLREYAIFHMGFSVVTKRNCIELKKIIKNNKVLEVMCGVGAYTATLRECGIDVVATDDMSWIDGDDKKYTDWKKYMWIQDIEKLDAINAVKKYGRSVGFILMSWPPQYDDIAYNVLLTMRKINPKCKMIYVGEWMGGCTANNTFFENAIDISGEYYNTSNFKTTFRAWHNDDYYDEQYILI